MADRKNPELDEKHQAILRKMMQLPENKRCADCLGPSPRWASTNLGIFVCISCSGIHRKLGTHISQVRSIKLDTWTPSQIAHFQKFGNAKAAQYFEACLPAGFSRPHAGDSLQMERFIRDKYEKKRYITVENGGLGGAAPDSGSRRGSHQANGNSLSSAGGRGSSGNSMYDDIGKRRGTAMPLSYGDKFRSGASMGNERTRNPKSSSGRFNLGRTLGPRPRPGNAIQRAHTLKELMNMGFSIDLASRAVEASGGDLQKAVDWILARSESTGVPQQQPARASQPPVERDLLDFGDPVSAPKAPTSVKPGQGSSIANAPKIMSTEPLTAHSSKTPAGSAPADDFADFADFGAFESALPTTTASTSAALTPTTANSLGSSLASLYAQGPKVPSRVSPKVSPTVGSLPSPFSRAGVAPMSSSKLPTAGKLSPRVSPTVTPMPSPFANSGSPKSALQAPKTVGSPKTRLASAHDIGRKVAAAGLPNAIPSFEWSAGNKGGAPKAAAVPASSTLPTTAAVPKSNTISFANTTSMAPPPPPLHGTPDPSTEEVPPPPDCPPPSKEQSTATPPVDETNSASTAEAKDDGGDHVKVEQSNGKAEEVADKEEDEDPFAALSMFAMTSAKSQKPATKEAAKQEPVQNSAPPPIDAAAAPGGDGGGIDLDALLGL